MGDQHSIVAMNNHPAARVAYRSCRERSCRGCRGAFYKFFIAHGYRLDLDVPIGAAAGMRDEDAMTEDPMKRRRPVTSKSEFEA
jgi:hypothetical protein